MPQWAAPAPAHVFHAWAPWQMAPSQLIAVQTMLAAEKKKPTIITSKQLVHGELAQQLRAKPAKETVPERQYALEDFQVMVREVLLGQSARQAALLAGFPRAERSLNRYVKSIRKNASLQRTTREETLSAQLEFVDGLLFAQKGNTDLLLRRIFSKDEEDVLASTLKSYSQLGWPLDYQQVRMLFADAARRKGRIDPRTGEPFKCSTSYVAAFIAAGTELKAFKASHIDPLRSKKATAQVMCAYSMCGMLCRSHVTRAPPLCRAREMMRVSETWSLLP